MIHELRITGLGVIAEAVAQFHPGFTAVTGETGAGKTMVVTGLGLLAGGRTDPAMIRTGELQTSVEGVFDSPAGVAEQVRQAGGELDGDDQHTIAARLVTQSRSRCVLGGRTVPVGVLGDAMADLLAIHGQNDQVRLGQRALALLDSYAGHSELVAQMADHHDRLRRAERELTELAQSEQERARELDSLMASLDEISQVDPKAGEEAALASEANRLAHADALLASVRTAVTALSGDDAAEGAPDALGMLAAARREVETAAALDPALGEHVATMRSSMAVVVDVASELAAYAADVEADPLRLDAVQQRQVDLARLTRKYGSDVGEVLAWAQEAAARVATLTGADDRIAELTDEVEGLRRRAGEAAGQLHELRVVAGHKFAAEVSAELAALAMPRARVAFDLQVTPDPVGVPLPGASGRVALRATGCDDVRLMLAANPGAPMRPIAQAASGGELSRVMLAIQVVLAGADPVPTMVFDEVDAGVGGAAAIEVGRRLQALSRVTQVIVVTHLPQVAAFADRHLVVSKDSSGTVTSSSIIDVAGQDRVRELSRMLGGMADSESAAAHAQELLAMAGSAAGGRSSRH